jgi:glycine/D-amino acid oxidase-like deaminating enzyme
MSYKTIIEDNIDILVVGAGLGGTGAAYEARYWGRNKKVIIAEKANIDRSGAVAQGLYAINCYIHHDTVKCLIGIHFRSFCNDRLVRFTMNHNLPATFTHV